MANDQIDEAVLYGALIVTGNVTEQRLKTIRQPFRDLDPNWFKVYVPALQASSPVNTGEGLPLDCKKLCLDEEGMPTVETLHYLQYCLGDLFQQANVILFVADCRDPATLLLAPCLGYLLSTKTISRQSVMIAITSEPGRFESLQQRLQFEQGRLLLRQYCDIVIINHAQQTLQCLQQLRRPLCDYFDQESQNIAAILKLFAEYFWGDTLIGMDFTWVVDALVDQGEAVFANGRGRGRNKIQQATEQSLATIQHALEL